MCQSFNGDEMKIAQELNVSFLGSSDNVIAPEVIEFQLNNNVVYLPDDWNLKDPFVEETWIWKDPIPGHRYICAVDASRGDAADKTAIEIIDIDAKDEMVIHILTKFLNIMVKEQVMKLVKLYLIMQLLIITL